MKFAAVWILTVAYVSDSQRNGGAVRSGGASFIETLGSTAFVCKARGFVLPERISWTAAEARARRDRAQVCFFRREERADAIDRVLQSGRGALRGLGAAWFRVACNLAVGCLVSLIWCLGAKY